MCRLALPPRGGAKHMGKRQTAVVVGGFFGNNTFISPVLPTTKRPDVSTHASATVSDEVGVLHQC